jgi:hypothetical protein
MMRQEITCRWCGRRLGLNHYELFDHTSCTTLAAPPEASVDAEDLSPEAEQRQTWLLQKQLNRLDRQLARLSR